MNSCISNEAVRILAHRHRGRQWEAADTTLCYIRPAIRPKTDVPIENQRPSPGRSGSASRNSPARTVTASVRRRPTEIYRKQEQG